MTVGTVGGAHPALALLASAAQDARKAAAMLSADEVWTAANADVITALRLQSQLEAATAAAGYAAVREADVRGLAAADGQSSTAVWLGRLVRLHPGEAKARVATATLLATQATDTAAALVNGTLNAAQARAVAAGLGQIKEHASTAEFTQAQAFLLREGRFLHAGQIARAARHIEACLDPDGTGERAERAVADRSFTVNDLGDGRHRIKGTLTDEGAPPCSKPRSIPWPRPAPPRTEPKTRAAPANATPTPCSTSPPPTCAGATCRTPAAPAPTCTSPRPSRPCAGTPGTPTPAPPPGKTSPSRLSAESPVTPASPRSSPTPSESPWPSAANPAPSPRPSGPPYSPATSAACSPAAPDPRPGAKATTSPTGSTAGKPP